MTEGQKPKAKNQGGGGRKAEGEERTAHGGREAALRLFAIQVGTFEGLADGFDPDWLGVV